MLTEKTARRLALLNAAALVRDSSLDQLFGDQVFEAALGNKQAESILDEAKKYVAAKLAELAVK